MEQIKRISGMEQILDEASEVIAGLNIALDKYERLRPKLEKLAEYYHSPQWLLDLDDDRAGRLPQDLKRGVLSEDAIYDLLAENGELLARLRTIGDSQK